MCLPFCMGIALDYTKNPDLLSCLGQIDTALQCAEDGQSKFIAPIKGNDVIFAYIIKTD